MKLDHKTLEDFAYHLMVAQGVGDEDSRLVAKSLVAANLRGVDSHGVQLLQYYLDLVEGGAIRIDRKGHIVNESGGCMLYDAEDSLGAPVAALCCEHANRLARANGIGLVVVREASHFGACAFWAQRLSAAGNIGIVLCNASPIVPPWQGREGRLGTNPICMSVPGPPESWLLDMATTTVAANRIFKAATNGVPEIPAGWLMDSQGRQTTDPSEVNRGGLIMPLGGYKGSGLAVMVEILCAVLGGGAIGPEVGGIRYRERPLRASQLFLAIDVTRFQTLETFESRMDKLVQMIKTTVPGIEYNEVLIAGEPERRIEADRLANGVPVEAGVWKKLEENAARLGVSVPELA